jgi:AmiR/NasT family two-component response regulator
MTVMLTDGMQAASSGDAAAELAALEVEQGEGAANARLYQMVSDRGANLERALEYRGAIERAKGLIMHERGVDANEAFEVLREISQRQNRKLRDVAIELLARNAGSQAASRQPPHR